MPKSDHKKADKVEAAIDAYCAKKNLPETHSKLCYSLISIKRQVATPFTNGLPMDKVCERLNKSNDSICSIKPPVKVEKGADYTKFKVRELKQILAARGVTCENCLEKSEYVKRCQETEHMEL